MSKLGYGIRFMLQGLMPAVGRGVVLWAACGMVLQIPMINAGLATRLPESGLAAASGLLLAACVLFCIRRAYRKWFPAK